MSLETLNLPSHSFERALRKSRAFGLFGVLFGCVFNLNYPAFLNFGPNSIVWIELRNSHQSNLSTGHNKPRH
jgi:hypothetical protein